MCNESGGNSRIYISELGMNLVFTSMSSKSFSLQENAWRKTKKQQGLLKSTLYPLRLTKCGVILSWALRCVVVKEKLKNTDLDNE